MHFLRVVPTVAKSAIVQKRLSQNLKNHITAQNLRQPYTKMCGEEPTNPENLYIIECFLKVFETSYK